MCFASLYVYAQHVALVPTGVRRGHKVPWNCSCILFGASMWALGIEPQSLGRVASALHS